MRPSTKGLALVADDTARRCAAAYSVATNVLVPLDLTADPDRSSTATTTSVVIGLERRAA